MISSGIRREQSDDVAVVNVGRPDRGTRLRLMAALEPADAARLVTVSGEERVPDQVEFER